MSDQTSSTRSGSAYSRQYYELAELAGQLVHEFRNHLGTIALNLQLMDEDLEQPATPRERRAHQRTQRLRQECQRLTDLSNDFLRFARLKELDLKPTDVNQVVTELLDFYTPSARQSGIEIKTFLSVNLPAVRLDKDLFKQAVLNLILNAGQSMSQGGELTIQTEVGSEGVRLALIDTGVGMTQDVASQIFRPFFSTRPGGTGLGLPTTRRIIEAHGGKIDVQSEPGRGTKFTIVLPVSQE